MYNMIISWQLSSRSVINDLIYYQTEGRYFCVTKINLKFKNMVEMPGKIDKQ